MDTGGGYASLRQENERLRQENDDLKLMLGLVKENQDLRSKVHNSSLTNDTMKESTVCSPGRKRDDTLDESRFRGRKTTLQWDDTLDESSFRRDLKSRPTPAHKTSSPIHLGSVHHVERPRSSMCTDPRTDEDLAASYSQSYLSKKVKDPERLMGEIAFQLDRRILSHVFQGHPRFYGFTVPNIRDKIIQVSTHPLTGRVDEAYRLQLSQRHVDLMDRLNQLGYSASFHPTFTEFIINTYGVLQKRPDAHTTQEQGFNNPDILRRVVINEAPVKLLKDLLLLLSCLCYLARQDGKPVFLW